MPEIAEIENLRSNSALVVQGPTASGKSGLALELAERLGGVVINADAMQVYQGIPIITAAPSAQDKQRAKHELYEIFPPHKNGNVAEWLDLAVEAVRLALRDGHVPIITGGTGFYIESLVKGISPIPPTKEESKQKTEEIFCRGGLQAAYAYLQEIDEAGAGMVRQNDTTRVRRALEIKLDTGKSIAEWFKLPLIKRLPEVEFRTISLLPELKELEARCARRFDLMMEQGALSEVRELLKLKPDANLPVMKAIGVPELAAYLRGDTSLEEAVEQAKLHTRQYAKRQLTWFRNRR